MPPAVVIGLCAHGLATVRSLAKSGVRVHAIEANKSLPGFGTRLAQVHWVKEIHGRGLIDALLELAAQHSPDTKPVLFPMNDKMVQCVGRYWEELSPFYLLSWSDCRVNILRLLNKSHLAQHCEERELLYPQSWVIESDKDLDRLRTQLSYPVVLKPSRPMGSFKTFLARNIADIEDLIAKHPADLPVLAQQWIEGDDAQLFFCALYLDQGNVLARIEGHKLRSSPPALGQGTIFESVVDEELYRVTRNFFADTNLTGPVALEVKKDPSSSLWVIEPTVGRTEFCVSVCIENGVPVPYVEYCQVVGANYQATATPGKTRWFDTEKDPLCYARFLLSEGRQLERQKAAFPFLDRSDYHPFTRGLWRTTKRAGTGLRHRLERLTGSRPRQ
jgi:predicted ATP-grasp superfamily ATP-dependent carboligase